MATALEKRVRRIRWHVVDWTQNDATLARLLRVPYVTVMNMRQRLNKGPSPRKSMQYDWLSVNWAESDVTIASRLGCSDASVRARRCKFIDQEIRDWSDKVDWCRPNYELSIKLGRSLASIEEYRRKFDRREFRDTSYSKEFIYQIYKRYESVICWDDPNHVTATLTKLPVQLVAEIREAYGHIYKKPKRQHGTKIDWRNVDWTLSDSIIGRKYGVTRQSANLWRKKLGKPKSPFMYMQNNKHQEVVEFLEDNRGKIVASGDIREKFGRNAAYISKVAGEFDIEIIKGRVISRILREVNWNLPTVDIANIWPHLTYGAVANHRSCNRRPYPKWRRMFGRKIDDPEYDKMYADELKRRDEFMRRIVTSI